MRKYNCSDGGRRCRLQTNQEKNKDEEYIEWFDYDDKKDLDEDDIVERDDDGNDDEERGTICRCAKKR